MNILLYQHLNDCSYYDVNSCTRISLRKKTVSDLFHSATILQILHAFCAFLVLIFVYQSIKNWSSTLNSWWVAEGIGLAIFGYKTSNNDAKYNSRKDVQKSSMDWYRQSRISILLPVHLSSLEKLQAASLSIPITYSTRGLSSSNMSLYQTILYEGVLC